ncbi:MAG TPA: hypothetical protein VI300_06090 [Solirubrobacter sp.]
MAVIGILLLFVVVPSRKEAAARPTPDRRDAATAALTFAQELAVTGVSQAAVYGPRLGRIAAPGAEARIRAAFGKGAEEVRRLIGETGILRAVPMGYRVDSFSARAASVSVWMVALAGGSRLEPTAQWRVLTLDLAWTSTGWRVTDGSGGGGPSPRTPLPLLATEAATFKEPRHVP